MISALRYFIIIAIIAVGAAWLADQPGSVSLQWGGYQIDTSFGVLAIAALAIAVISALLYRLWLFITRAPGTVRLAWRAKRRNKGFQALTKGMVAVAAGDAGEARRQAKRAEGILSDPPLTMLLSAQAAQLNGDERAAERFFKAMTDNHETAFLGLRGLLNQAMARGDTGEAVQLARRAHRLKPDSEWVSKSLFELQTKSGQWLDASVTTREATRNKHLSADVSHRRQAVLAYQLSMAAHIEGDSEEALKQARAAFDHDNTFLPAALATARLWNYTGKQRKASALIEKVWANSPHPDLVADFILSRKALDPLSAVKAVERLVKSNPGNIESYLAMARVALDADLWGQARANLEKIVADPAEKLTEKSADPISPPARVCRLMAELEEVEHGDMAASRSWLVKASHGDPDPAYVCNNCGHTVRDWHATCDKCDTFDAYQWRTPPHVMDPQQTVVTMIELAEDTIEAPATEQDNGSLTLIEHDNPEAGVQETTKPLSAP